MSEKIHEFSLPGEYTKVPGGDNPFAPSGGDSIGLLPQEFSVKIKVPDSSGHLVGVEVSAVRYIIPGEGGGKIIKEELTAPIPAAISYTGLQVPIERLAYCAMCRLEHSRSRFLDTSFDGFPGVVPLPTGQPANWLCVECAQENALRVKKAGSWFNFKKVQVY